MNDVSPGKLTIIIGGLVVFLFSFFPWISAGGFSRSAWSSGMLPVATWAPLCALAATVLIALPAFAGMKLPEKVLDFTIDQLVLILAAFSFLIVFGYAVTDKGGASVGFGVVFGLLGAIAQLVGIYMDRAGVGTHPGSATSGYNAPLIDPAYPQQVQGFPPAAQPQAPQQQPQAPQPQAPQQQPASPPPAQAPPAQPDFPGQPPAPPAQTEIPGQPGPGAF